MSSSHDRSITAPRGNGAPTPDRFSFRARLRSFRYAFRGIRAVLITQHNAWIHLAATIAAVGAGAALRISRMEWVAIVLATVAVWVAEALNTAIEALCDVTSTEFHPQIERAKDVAAGAVLISAVGAVCVALLIFGHRMLSWIR
jgi:diacylglycerol kinase